MKRVVTVTLLSVFIISGCTPKTVASPAVPFAVPAIIPLQMQQLIEADRDRFVSELNMLLSNDKDGLLILVDKKHELPADWAPKDLVSLGSKKSYKPNRDGLSLRAGADVSLEKMAAAARMDGVTLVVSSSFRSYDYQKTIYERNVHELGQAVADRESARPGTSQHQLGTVVDFGSITDEFAQTTASKWLTRHAVEYGWSLSFPNGFEAVTGYRWESWHYRYLGVEAATFQKKWFGDIQQYMMEFIDAWKKYQGV